MSIFEILKSKDSSNPILSGYLCEVHGRDNASETCKPTVINVPRQVTVPANIEDTFCCVGKALVKAFRRGEIGEEELLRSYRKNVAEAEAFCAFGYKMQELQDMARTTHNPALKAKLSELVAEKRELQRKSNLQNHLTLEKLNRFKSDVLGMGVGLRKVILSMRKCYKRTGDKTARIISMLLETEYANVNAKRLPSADKKMAYERKSRLLSALPSLLFDAGWRFGYNESAGKNASYLVFVYLPSGVQLTWHCNDYTLPYYYNYISDEWDGQVCMTLEKILSYIKDHYCEYICGSMKNAA